MHYFAVFLQINILFFLLQRYFENTTVWVGFQIPSSMKLSPENKDVISQYNNLNQCFGEVMLQKYMIIRLFPGAQRAEGNGPCRAAVDKTNG